MPFMFRCDPVPLFHTRSKQDSGVSSWKRHNVTCFVERDHKMQNHYQETYGYAERTTQYMPNPPPPQGYYAYPPIPPAVPMTASPYPPPYAPSMPGPMPANPPPPIPTYPCPSPAYMGRAPRPFPTEGMPPGIYCPQCGALCNAPKKGRKVKCACGYVNLRDMDHP